MKKYIIGITGGIASGKTLISLYLQKKYQFDIICADKISNLILNFNFIKNNIINHFGINFIQNNKINKKKLKKNIFKNKKNIIYINKLMQPIIHKYLKYFLQASKNSITIVIIPLLNKNNLEQFNYLDYVINISSPIKIRLKRITQRDRISTTSAINIIKQQPTEQERNVISNFIINGNDKKHKIYKNLDKHIKKIQDEINLN